jgi:hypothetical protein
MLAFLDPRNPQFVQADPKLKGMPDAKWVQDRLIRLGAPGR